MWRNIGSFADVAIFYASPLLPNPIKSAAPLTQSHNPTPTESAAPLAQSHQSAAPGPNPTIPLFLSLANTFLFLSLSDPSFFLPFPVADHDVLRAFDPRWLTQLECSFLWIAGRKPALAFRFVPRGDHLSHPLAAVEGLRREVAKEERALAAAMDRVQEGLAARDVVEAVRRAPGRNGQERSNAEAAVEDSLRSLLNAADTLRVRAVRAIVDIL